jgi:VanZ family protein
MLKRIKNLFHKIAVYIAVFITAFIAFLSLIKVEPNALMPITSSDKVYHGIAYFCLTLSWLYSFSKKESFDHLVKYLILGCFIYGIVIEVLQTTITSYRTASYLDIVANSVGILIAVLAFHFFEKKIRVI